MADRTAARKQKAALRAAQLSDALELTRFESRVFVGYYAPHRFSIRQFRYYLGRPRTIAYAARVGGVIVGYVLGTQHTGRLSHVARLSSIAVDAACRRRGLAVRLLAAFVAAARKRACRLVFLEVATKNREARNLFARRGFSRVRLLRGYYSPSVDALRLRLALN